MKDLLSTLYWNVFTVTLVLVWSVPILILLALSLKTEGRFQGSGQVQLDEYIKKYKEAHKGE